MSRLQTPLGAATVYNRLRAVLLHVPFYSIEGVARLAADYNVSKSTISRLLSGKTSPSYRLADAITEALSKRLGKPIDPREIFSREGRFPTPSACALMRCSGCLPPDAWSEKDDKLRPEWRHQKPGEWSRQQASPHHPGFGTLTQTC
jgi:transcriptional regulator with XRE-family HTH domain